MVLKIYCSEILKKLRRNNVIFDKNSKRDLKIHIELSDGLYTRRSSNIIRIKKVVSELRLGGVKKTKSRKREKLVVL